VSESDAAGSGDESDEPRGKVDFVALLYILGGIPAIVAYVVIAFVLARFLNFPA
jgi:hypothetical protein